LKDRLRVNDFICKEMNQKVNFKFNIFKSDFKTTLDYIHCSFEDHCQYYKDKECPHKNEWKKHV